MSDIPKIMPYDGDPCACVNCADEDATLFYNGEAVCLTCCQACEINAQAAELTRLRARIEAADRLARAVVIEADKAGMDHAVLDALSAYEGEKG